MIRHMVFLRFPASTPKTAKDVLYDALAGLTKVIDGAPAFHRFDNVSPETPVVRGFTEGFWFDFRDAAVRDAYLVHPAHQAVAAQLVAATDGGPEGVFVCDVVL